MLPSKRVQAGCPAASGLHAIGRLPVPIVARPCRSNLNADRNVFLVVSASHDEQAYEVSAEDPRSRRMQRAQRREARRRTTEPQDASDDADEDFSDDSEVSTQQEALQPSRLSRIAARRAQRSRGARRVPAAVVPADIAESDDEDDEDAVRDLADVTSDSSVQDQAVAGSAAAAEDSTDEDEGSSADADNEDAMSELPTSVLDAANRSSADPAASIRQKAGSKQQQNIREPLQLKETNPMYIPVLTDEDLDNDPPGHRSGYVAVIGRPNAGKSTLINAIVGQKLSIVTYKPQTTRHRVVGIASAADYQMILFDTPGIMAEQRSKLDERMMAAVVSSIKAAEVIIAVVDSGDDPQEALAMFQPGPDWNGPPMAVLLNKADLLEDEQIQQLEQWYKTNCRAEQVFVGSALSSSDKGVAAIKSWAVGKLPEGPTLYPKSMVSEQPERFFVSEMIREQIFLQYAQEIPYACQVVIEEFEEHPGHKDFIKALILVERESQVPIVLGSGGSKITKLGATARAEIEQFLERPVYLQLSVQVAPSWRQQPDKLKDFGYFDPLYIT